VLDGVNLYVKKGERVGLAGETGCGKSLTMKMVMGMIKVPPAIVPSGEVLLNGKNVVTMGDNELMKLKGQEVSMVFQDPMNALNPVFSIRNQFFDVIRYAGKSRKEARNISKDQLKDIAVQGLREVRLPDPERILNNYPMELSGGMCQRVLIAMALVNKPGFLIADEPGTALDVTIQAQILELLKDLVRTRGISILLITHNLGVIQTTTERVYIMYGGQIAETAPTAQLFKNPKHPYTRGLLASVPRLTGGEIAEGIRGTVPDYTEAPSGCRFNPRCPNVMDVCKDRKPPLVEVGEEHSVGCYLYTQGKEAHG
jgi:peptide/nickel transport system ATP-binding protein